MIIKTKKTKLTQILSEFCFNWSIKLSTTAKLSAENETIPIANVLLMAGLITTLNNFRIKFIYV